MLVAFKLKFQQTSLKLLITLEWFFLKSIKSLKLNRFSCINWCWFFFSFFGDATARHIFKPNKTFPTWKFIFSKIRDSFKSEKNYGFLVQCYEQSASLSGTKGKERRGKIGDGELLDFTKLLQAEPNIMPKFKMKLDQCATKSTIRSYCVTLPISTTNWTNWEANDNPTISSKLLLLPFNHPFQ